MSDAARPIAVETLLAERAWVRALARRLVADDATADDVVQQTWLAALESPPRDSSALRGWLSRVVRNAASESHRRAKRRERWEAMAPPRPAEVSPADVVATADAHRRVVDAVMALDEPYRAAVLLRFFEGLESDEVARRTGVPVETARTRIKRALALLRGRLDREHGGDGRAWAVALVPLAGGGSDLVGTLAKGGAVMASATKTTVAAAVVGALIGALVTATALDPRPEVERPTAAQTQTAAASQEGAAPAADPARDATKGATPAPGSKSTPDVAKPTTAPRPSLSAAIDEIPVELPPRGHGVITGRVRTKDGAPFAGAVVRAWPPRTPPRYARGGVPPLPSVEESVRSAAIDAKWRAATTREAVSGADGSYALTGLVDSAHYLGAWAEGHSIGAARGSDASDVRPGATVDFVAWPVVEVPVTVLLPDGSPPKETVTIRWTAGRRGGGSSRRWTPDDPVVAVEPGAWDFVAEIGKDVRSPPVAVEVAAGRATEPVTLRLVERSVVFGAVRFDAADAGWDYAWVKIHPRGAIDMRNPVKDAGVRPPDWKFRFEDLEPGEYDLTVSLDGITSDAMVGLRFTGGRVERDLVVPPMPAARSLRVRVVGPDGEALPADEVQLSIVERGGGGVSTVGGRRVPQPDGSSLLSLRPPSLPRAQLFVQATSKSFGVKEVEFVPGETKRVEIRYSAPAIFQPTIVGAEGTAMARRLVVRLVRPDASDLEVAGSRDDPPFPPVEPGAYVAKLVLASADGGLGRVIARVPVRLAAGVNPVTIRVPELHSLNVRISDASKGTQVWASSADRPGRADAQQSVMLSDDRVASFGELPAGNYLVQTTLAGEMREMVVRVPTGGDVAFAPTTLPGLAVRIDDDAGLMAKSGFQTGDVIVAVDGVAIDSIGRIDAVFHAARGRGEVPVELRRGARTVTLTIDASRFWMHGGAGGAWAPIVR
jgi:RNA polymerase sigma-70 factor (ECF subfamily)